ncbi:MAG TPA: hypothetical protein DCZ20_05585 [Lachnospiraceae bacterium]|nr:hypothetical protein [Lachnospiraceae bacterium]
MNIDKTVGNNIRKYRTAYNMTLKELSEKLHKSISTVSKYEKGDISLDLPTFIELARILNVSPELLLGDEAASVKKEHSYSAASTRLYMYTYDSQNKCVVQSVIEQYPSTTQSNLYRAQLFNDVEDTGNPGNCGGLYVGEYMKEGFIGTYILRNQISSSEHVMISCVTNLVNPNQQLGLVSGLSNYTMLPVTFKAILSSTEMTNKEMLSNALLFSKEDFKMMKKINYLTIQNPR